MAVDMWHKDFIDTSCITVMMEALNHNVDIDCPIDEHLNTKLLFATKKQDMTMVNCLIGRNANINILNDKRRSAIMMACKYSNFDIYCLLYEKGAVVRDVKCFKYCMSNLRPNARIFNHLFQHGYVIVYREHKNLLEKFLQYYVNSPECEDDILNSLCAIISQFENIFPYVIRIANEEFFIKISKEHSPTLDDLILSYKLGSMTDEILKYWVETNNYEHLSNSFLFVYIRRVGLEQFRHILSFLDKIKTQIRDIIDFGSHIDKYSQSYINQCYDLQTFQSFQSLYYYGYLTKNIMNFMLINFVNHKDDIDKVTWIVKAGVDIDFTINDRSFLGVSFENKAYVSFDFLLKEGAKFTDSELLKFCTSKNIDFLRSFMSNEVFFAILKDKYYTYSKYLEEKDYTTFLKYCLKTGFICEGFLTVLTHKNLDLSMLKDHFHKFYQDNFLTCNPLLFHIFRKYINTLNSSGTYPLYFMCKKGSIDHVRILLQLGANPDMTTLKGKTALYASNNIDITDLLLNFGATLDVQCNKGNTPLMNCLNKISKNGQYYEQYNVLCMGTISIRVACGGNYICFLLKKGANFTKRNKNGQSFSSSYMKLVRYYGYNEIHQDMSELKRTLKKSKKNKSSRNIKLVKQYPPKREFYKYTKSERQFVYQCKNRSKD